MVPDITEVSMLHHAAIILALLCFLSSFGWSHPIAFFLSFVYLCLVHEIYTLRLHKRLQFEERKSSNQRKLLSDSESVRWLNHAVEKVWPICMERIASQQFLLPIIPWFLEKYKPWTARKAVVQHLYLGKNPPMFTEIRVHSQSADDDHLVLELGMNFLSADDMSAILAVKLRKRLGFGIWAKMHVTGMHVEGKVFVGVKFLRQWPFLERVRVSFIEPPYFQMTVKPIFNHGLDVTEIPGIAGWLDKILSVAFEQTLVEPNMLVVDVEKFVSTPPGSTEKWFTVDEKRPIAFAKVEIIEGVDMKPSDMNGLADPYVKGQLGPYKFRTKIQWKTLAPNWFEEFKIPIRSWDVPNLLVLEVRDKDRIFDDTLGNCTLNIGELRGGQRHDKWLPLENIKMGRLHLAVTILDGDDDEAEHPNEDGKLPKMHEDTLKSRSDDEDYRSPDISSESQRKIADEFEPIPIEGQQKIGVWVHRPGNEVDVSQKWEPRKGKVRQHDTELQCEDIDSPRSAASGCDTNSSEENQDGKRRHGLHKVKQGLKKFGSVFHRSPKSPKSSAHIEHEQLPIPTTPLQNIRAVGDKGVGVTLIVDKSLAENVGEQKVDQDNGQPSQKGDVDSSGKNHAKDLAKGILKQAGSLRHALSRKSFKKEKDYEDKVAEADPGARVDSSSEEYEPLSPLMVESAPIEIASTASNYDEESVHNKEGDVQAGVPDNVTDIIGLSPDPKMDSSPGSAGSGVRQPPVRKVSFREVEEINPTGEASVPRCTEGSSNSKVEE